MQEMWVRSLGRPSGEGNGNPPQYSWLGNLMDRRAWQVTVHGVAKESDMTQRLNNNKLKKREKFRGPQSFLSVQKGPEMTEFEKCCVK